jgi:PelA/Pel-15E family pectate lyase
VNAVRLLCFCLLAISPLAAQVRWSAALRQPEGWYAEPEAAAMASNVLLYQHASGGWPKNVDMSVAPTQAQQAAVWFNEPTIDNGATTSQIEFLARLHGDQPHPTYRAAIERGLDYLLAAQSPSGGWPQFFPRKSGYYSHITYNDNAMANVLTLLRAVSQGKPPYQFVNDDQRSKASRAIERAVVCILRTQIVQEGQLTVWCAQHDEATLAPAWARNFEPPSLSGHESVGIVRFLMSVDRTSPEIIAAIEGAVAWLRANAISGLRVQTTVAADGARDRIVVSDPTAPSLWARFYELGTNRPIFLGRDRVVRYDHNEIERERRVGYSYLGNWPAALIDKEYPAWKAHQASRLESAQP